MFIIKLLHGRRLILIFSLLLFGKGSQFKAAVDVQ